MTIHVDPPTGYRYGFKVIGNGALYYLARDANQVFRVTFTASTAPAITYRPVMADRSGIPPSVSSVVKIAMVEKPAAAPRSDSVARPRPGAWLTRAGAAGAPR